MLLRHLLAPALVLSPAAALAAEIPLQPGDDFCAAFNAAAPGDTVVLAPGEYSGPCVLSSGGAPGMPKTLRGADPDDHAVIVYAGQSSNVLDVLASDIVIADLTLGPSGATIDAIKIKDGSRITIQSCLFDQVGGISIAANSKDSDGVQILGNTFLDLQATGIYLGCQDGMDVCAATNVVIADNLFDGVDSSAVGYAMELKLDSHGVVRDNVIHDTKGPGIEIYGSTDLARVSVVERNLVIGSRTAGTIEIGGGPAVVRNNIVVGGAEAGLYVYDYQNRDLVRAIHLVGNTVVGDEGPAILLKEWAAGKDLELTGNAAWQSAGAGPAVPAAIPGVAMAGNVDCTDDPAACWLDAAARDFWPTEGSPLRTDGAAPTLADPLTDDFCGQPRGAVPHAGALEWTMSQGPGGLPVALKSSFPCPQDGETTGDPTGEGTTGEDTTGDPTGEPTTDAPTTGAPGSTTDAPTTTDASTTDASTADGSATDASTSSPGAATASSDSATTDADPSLDGDSGCGCHSRHEPAALPLLALLGLLRRRRRAATSGPAATTGAAASRIV
ncbi:right-handed parallel beta-helix repeat-containing protein [Nannocystis exedens]|uniref:right-handed parallel beta-helix repeat-containing protein n=1 Tax=Nannocystis exedens TaxID=54 RepID=UPI000BBA0047|nr:right-handed parallel beta-helix repeat-containing protein [Nannocystis exedens]PCC68578.1 hypothetical protein NAEX_01594 [Nannocystis exedens]